MTKSGVDVSSISFFHLSLFRASNSLSMQTLDIICSKKQTVFWEQSSKKIASSKGLMIMSKDKYRSLFLKPNEATVFIIFQIFFATLHLGNITGYSLVLAGAYSVT